MSIQTNAAQVAARFERVQVAVRTELESEGNAIAQRLAAEMRRRAPKGVRSLLTNSVRVEHPAVHEFIIRPTAAYAANVERGRKPGKGLPRFFDPAAAGAVAWLEGMLTRASIAANPAFRSGRVGSARRTAAELELRDRYFMWSRAVKARGIKAQPFVKPTADALRAAAHAAMVAAVRRGLAKGGSTT